MTPRPPPPPELEDAPGPESRAEREPRPDPLRNPTPTGVWHLAHGRYGRRAGDKPYPWAWLIAYRFAERLGDALTLAAKAAGAVVVYYVAKRMGVQLP